MIETASFAATPDAPRYAVIGIGINLASPPAQGLATPPAWLRELHPDAAAPELLLRIAAPLAQTLRAFEALGFAPFRARFEARDVLRDRYVGLSDGREGTAHGVTDTGGLLVHTAAGMEEITSSELSVRPC